MLAQRLGRRTLQLRLPSTPCHAIALGHLALGVVVLDGRARAPEAAHRIAMTMTATVAVLVETTMTTVMAAIVAAVTTIVAAGMRGAEAEEMTDSMMMVEIDVTRVGSIRGRTTFVIGDQGVTARAGSEREQVCASLSVVLGASTLIYLCIVTNTYDITEGSRVLHGMTL